MACLNMIADEQKGLFMGPRVSFSSDFVADTQMAIKQENKYREAPVSSDFEFSVTKNCSINMIDADEIFSKGMLMPFQDTCIDQFQKMTLRDTLLVDDDCGDILPRPPKVSGRWRERLGFKKTSFGKKNGEIGAIVQERKQFIATTTRTCEFSFPISFCFSFFATRPSLHRTMHSILVNRLSIDWSFFCRMICQILVKRKAIEDYVKRGFINFH